MKVLQKHKIHIFLFLILLLAGFLRLYKIRDYLTFLGDEGRDVLVVYNILHGHLTLLGPTSSVGGFFLGPIYYYFMAPFLWAFHYDPVGPAVMVALFGIVTVWLVYFVGRKFFNTSAGLIAALLYSISPLVITYARSSWNPNLMPITTLLLLYILYLGVKTKQIRYFLLSGFLFGIAMQLHYIEVFIGAISFVYIVLGGWYQFSKKEFPSLFVAATKIIKDVCYFGVGFVIGWSPFLAFEVRHGFNNIRAISNFIFHASTSGNGVGVSPGVLATLSDVFFRVFGRLILNIPSPNLYGSYPPMFIVIWTVVSWVIGVSAIGFLIWLLWKEKNLPAGRQGKILEYVLLLLWIGLGILFFGLYKKNIYDYYFEFLFPVPFLLVGALFSFLWSKGGIIKLLTSITMLVIVLVNLQGVPFRFPANQQLLQAQTISQFVLDQTNNEPFNFALITGGNSDHAYRYFFTIWGHPPVTIQYPGVDPKRTTVTKQLLVVCESLPCYPLGDPLWEIAGFGRAQIAGQWNVSVVQVYKLVHYSGK